MLAVPLTDYYEEVRRYLTCPEEVKDDLIYKVLSPIDKFSGSPRKGLPFFIPVKHSYYQKQKT